MPFSLTYVCQGVQKTPSINALGDYLSINTTVAHGATKETTSGPKPSALTELIIDTDVACTVNCGEETALTLPAGGLYVWSNKSGVDCYFQTATEVTPFTIVSTEASADGEVRIAWKASEAS